MIKFDKPMIIYNYIFFVKYNQFYKCCKCVLELYGHSHSVDLFQYNKNNVQNTRFIFEIQFISQTSYESFPNTKLFLIILI